MGQAARWLATGGIAEASCWMEASPESLSTLWKGTCDEEVVRS